MEFTNWKFNGKMTYIGTGPNKGLIITAWKKKWLLAKAGQEGPVIKSGDLFDIMRSKGDELI